MKKETLRKLWILVIVIWFLKCLVWGFMFMLEHFEISTGYDFIILCVVLVLAIFTC